MSTQLCVALSNNERSNRTHRCEIQFSRLRSMLSAMRALTVTGVQVVLRPEATIRWLVGLARAYTQTTSLLLAFEDDTLCVQRS